MRVARTGSLLALLVLIMTGCGADTSGAHQTSYESRLTEDAGIAVDATMVSDAEIRRPGESFIGHWAHRQVLSGFTDLPVFGATYSETVGTFKLEMIDDVDGVVVLMETCSVVLRRTVDAVTTTIPQQFIDALPISVRPAKIEGDEITIRSYIELNGVRLNNPQEDPLPTDADDPRIYDQDGDNKPGMTVLVAGILDGEVQVVQRTRTRHQGTLTEETINGTVQWAADEEILGADNAALAQGASVEPHMDLEKSWFVARPISQGKTCEEILNEAETLFPEDVGIEPDTAPEP